MGPISFLTESEMQQDLDFFANAQFSYDVTPLYAQHQHIHNGYQKGLQQHQHQQPSQQRRHSEDKWDSEDYDQISEPVNITGGGRPPRLSKDEKRKRNTAASARFRVKKKMREQILQQTALEMTEKSKRLESHIKDLEREIQWLKSLVMEKNDSRLEALLRERPAVTCTHHHNQH
ncbi:hypothetical protein BX666DRAFT_1949486 [Dichotomocladium elegans]|nr:hypothetical protein BX666DRAFT_1949486 [Dichotomocladium elegans]